MRWTQVSPCAARPARTREALALRSEAMTGAPKSLSWPLMMAEAPSMEMRAPMRSSSGTWVKRLG